MKRLFNGEAYRPTGYGITNHSWEFLKNNFSRIQSIYIEWQSTEFEIVCFWQTVF
ncbi:MAG: hypothetical protein LBJ00_15920 [Planctomycetaceae bacterium]|nr:hypothetical protein [Planctomycetaceae bacterium]